jgi:hypothetical protein
MKPRRCKNKAIITEQGGSKITWCLKYQHKVDAAACRKCGEEKEVNE